MSASICSIRCRNHYRDNGERSCGGRSLPEKSRKTKFSVNFAKKRIHDALDAGYGSCYLRDDRLAKIVEGALLHFDGVRYELHSWCVMPNHVHILFTPTSGFQMSEIVHSWKSFTAHECNKILGRSGRFWEREPFDRYIRSQRHFLNTVKYIENNPVKAGLCELPEDWLWSSARRQKDQMREAAGVRT